jgi:hypothetical protein
MLAVAATDATVDAFTAGLAVDQPPNNGGLARCQ